MAPTSRPREWGATPDTADVVAAAPPPPDSCFVVDSCFLVTASRAVSTPSAPTLPATALYLTEKGDTTAISVDDLHQGQIGDCFLISPIGELAINHPTAIGNMIHVNANGSETVTLYTDAAGRVPSFATTVFKPVAVTVNNVFPTYAVNNGATQDMVDTQKEIWPQVIEKAVATADGGYGAIANGGSPLLAMEQLTGHRATSMSPSSLTAATLQSMSAAGDLVVMDTYGKNGLPYNLVGNHAYMFEKLTTVNGTPTVQLGNPWGFDQPAPIPLAQLSKGIAEVDIGHVS